MELPDWLDERFLETVLQEGNDNRKVAVLNFSARPATSAGENYTSYLYRVSVEYKTDKSADLQSASLIIKTPPSSGMFYEFTKESDLWSVEPLLYNILLPRIIKKVNWEFAPGSFTCPIKNVLVLKDLKPDGYVVLDRVEQLDFPHCKMVIEMFAKFHAGSVACYHEDPDLVKTVGKESFFQRNGPYERRMKVWLEASFRQCAKTLEVIGGHEATVDLLRRKSNTIWESILNICNPKSNSLNLLTHGDGWTNNFLFKYSPGGQLTDLKVIDFQMARLGSPVLDLTLFIWSSANEEVREKRHQELYSIYLKILNKTLEDLGCQERLTLESLQEDTKANRDWILFTVCFLLPFYLCDSEGAIDLGSLTLEQLKAIEEDPRFQQMFNNKNFKRIIPGISRQLQASQLF